MSGLAARLDGCRLGAVDAAGNRHDDRPHLAQDAAQDSPLELFATLAEIALGDRTADMLDLTQDEPRGDVCTVRGPAASPPQP